MAVLVSLKLKDVLEKLGASPQVMALAEDVDMSASFSPQTTKVFAGPTAQELQVPSMSFYKATSGKASQQELLSLAGILFPVVGRVAMRALVNAANHGEDVELTQGWPPSWELMQKETVWQVQMKLAQKALQKMQKPEDDEFEELLEEPDDEPNTETDKLYAELTGTADAATEKEMTAGVKVMLRHASKMYQPVRGTDATSRYHVVAIGEGLNMAARWSKNGMLSIRIEGDQLKEKTPELMKTGLFDKGKIDGDHVSVHMEVGPNEITVQKVLGAAVAVLPVPVKTPIPQAKRLWGKGQ